ncbi:MAG TPA: glycosyltransferase family 39 protein [Chthonomonadales bacterium]|nr:glycosyltransferase family 39 protein [Chthonomonadales bacterium]
MSDPGPGLSPLPPQASSLTGWNRLALPALVALYLAAAIAHAAIAPTGATGYQNAPDEAAHVKYALTLSHGGLPTRHMAERDRLAQSYEWHQPPLYYLLAAALAGLGERWMRAASIHCGVITILLTYRCARLLFPEPPLLAAVAAALPALTPAHIAITSTVNNDALTETLFTAVLLILALGILKGFNHSRRALLGVLLGAALLTKSTCLLLVPIVAFGLWLAVLAGESGSNAGQTALQTAVFAWLICGWWFVRNGVLYHEWLPVRAFEQSFAGTAQARDLADRLGGWAAYWQVVLRNTFKSFWAVYGSPLAARQGIQLFLPAQAYFAPAAAVLCAIFGGLRKSSPDSVSTGVKNCIWLMAATLAAVLASFLLFASRYFQAQGRYLYPAMLPISLLLALGWSRAVRRKYQVTFFLFVIGFLAALDAVYLKYVFEASH